jgi:Astacin (Peptidase family M12A)
MNGIDVGRYDYCSIMHYSQTGGAQPGLKAFSILKHTACNVGQRIAMSRKDIRTVKKIYP